MWMFEAKTRKCGDYVSRKKQRNTMPKIHSFLYQYLKSRAGPGAQVRNVGAHTRWDGHSAITNMFTCRHNSDWLTLASKFI